MRNPLRSGFLLAHVLVYRAIRPILFRRSAQHAHEDMIALCKRLDRSQISLALLRALHCLAFAANPVTVGGTTLQHGFILAAGLVKGKGFETEEEALQAVQQGKNIIPGWRAVPALIGPLEYGSYTRWPRLGNPGVVVWRNPKTRSTQNRVGLRNPGAVAAAEFLANHANDLPSVFGINIAISPGVTTLEQETQEAIESIQAFVTRGVFPGWFTLNLSCPNTEDDPSNHQTQEKTRAICTSIVDYLRSVSDKTAGEIPLWIKISPGLHESQYATLMKVFEETGVQAVVATNTLPMPAPSDPTVIAGAGGGQLHAHAVRAVEIISREKSKHGYSVDIIGCGGIHDKATYQVFSQYGVTVVQYWSGLVFQGPLMAAFLS